MNIPARTVEPQQTPTAQPPKRDRHSLTDASQASLQGHLRPAHHADVEAYVLSRLPALMRLGYIPDEDAETRTAIMREHLGVLCDLPIWAIAEAMDAWVAQHNRRPAPAELRILANRAIEPITREIEDRKQAQAEQAEHERRKNRASPEAVARILHENGMTASRLERIAGGNFNRMAMAVGDIDKLPASSTGVHWTETTPPDDPRWDELRRARAASPVTNMGAKP